jgi:hypothetical protein
MPLQKAGVSPNCLVPSRGGWKSLEEQQRTQVHSNLRASRFQEEAACYIVAVGLAENRSADR